MKRLAVLALAVTAWSNTEFRGLADVDAAITRAIEADQVPGAVVLIGRQGRVIYRKAYGARSLTPAREPMTEDTVFDSASLTKVVATATAATILLEEGRLRLNDRVIDYLPEFQAGQSEVTVRHLLAHFSGLRPTLDIKTPWGGYATGISKALTEKPVAAPGERFIYSDVNYILLGEIVRRVSGNNLPEFCRQRIYEPLGMADTMFVPPASLVSRIAPTERPAGFREPLRGVVHDEVARAMEGLTGHAGLFTTADDLSRYAEMILGLGQRSGVRILSEAGVRKMTTPQSPGFQPVLRGLGWDIDSPYSGNRGELFPVGSFGHTGFTGTSLWIDPQTESYVVLLANSVHPKRRPAITSLRGRVASIAAASFGVNLAGVSLTGYNETVANARRPVARNGRTLTGLDVLAARRFDELQGRRVGLITNHTGLDREGKRNIDLMLAAGVKISALFSPEHGLGGRDDHEKVAHGKDEVTGLPIWSLYLGSNRRPSPEMLRGLDVLVFDMQDVGARFYTYMCTMLYAMEEAGKLGIPFLVLDRPNPINGVHVEGPLLDQELESFVGCCTLPLRHGMTLGEIARLANAERKLKANLKVIAMEGWQRGDWFDSTGLSWINPSPNMRSLNAALLYPGVAMLEYLPNYSVGRGTDSPFEQIGADWIKGPELAAYLNARQVPGVRFYPTRLTPDASRFAGKQIEGVRFVITEREVFQSVRLGLEIAAALEKLYPGQVKWELNARLIGNRRTIESLQAGEDPRLLAQRLADELAGFLETRRAYLLY